MKLSSEEQKFYEQSFQNLIQNDRTIRESNCRNLLKRGIPDPDISDKIWNLVSSNGTKTNLKKKDLFKLLKYIAAYQNGYNLEEVLPENLPELPIPSLPKKKKGDQTMADSSNQNCPSHEDSTSNLVPRQGNGKNFVKMLDEQEETEKPQLMGSPSTDSQISQNDLVKYQEVDEQRETTADFIDKEDSRNNSMTKDLNSPKDVLNQARNKTDLFENEALSSRNVKLHFSPQTERSLKESISSGRTSETRKSKGLPYISMQSLLNPFKFEKYLEQTQKIHIEIGRVMTHNSGLFGLGTFTSYFINSVYADSGLVLDTQRRFSDFDWLNSYFRSCPQYKGLVFPKLPEKRPIANTGPEFIQQRKVELEKYLREISRHKILSKDAVLRIFLGEKGGEAFQTLKETRQFNGIVLPELDWQKMKEVYEYAIASVKVKLQKETLPVEWKDSNDKIYDILRIDGMISKLLKIIQRKQEANKQMEIMNDSLNILHTKVMNRVNQEAYHAIGSLSSLFVARSHNIQDESLIIENFMKDIKMFKSRVDCCKDSYALLISTLQEIGTNKELYKNRQAKMFEYKAEKNDGNLMIVVKELNEIEKKVETLEKETVIIRDNLNLEAETLNEQFEAFLPDVLSVFYSNQTNQLKKITTFWENISQE